MKKLLFIALAIGLFSCSNSNKSWVVEMYNPMDVARVDESVVLTRDQLTPSGDDMLPAVQDSLGNFVASQIDDLDGDGKWDELAFVTDLAPAQITNMKIVWVAKDSYPQFPVRTNVRYGKMTTPGKVVELTTDVNYKDNVNFINTDGYPYQMDGIAWENDKVGFRHYFDGRNCRDFFGKKVTDMVLDTVGIRADGTPGDTYHVMADWGRDIMSVSTSFGLGGIGGWTSDSTFVRLGRTNADSVDVIDSTRFTLLIEGPVRSRFAIDFYGWEVGEGKKVDLRQEVTIWAGKHNYDNKVILKSELPANLSLITGLVRNFNDMPLESLEFNGYTAMATHDMQSYNKEFWFGMALLLPRENVASIFDTPNENAPLTTTWCAQLRFDGNNEAAYKAFGAWEHEDTMFRDRAYFMDMIKSEGDRADHPVSVILK